MFDGLTWGRLLAVAAAMLLASCTDKDGASRAVRDSGLTLISLDGYDPWACGKDDSYSTRFTARNIRGDIVHGTVCSGIFKGNTVRFD